MNEQDEISKRLEELLKQQKVLSKQIKEIRLLRKKNNCKVKINWKAIAFQQRIFDKIWDWASPHAKGNGITLAVVIGYIANLSTDPNKVKKSLEEIKKLQNLPEEVAIKKARSFINNKRNALHKNKNKWC